MSIPKLRSHIPIAGPARREPIDGTETAMRVSLGFVPRWFSARCGTDFGKRWHTDPYYRYKALNRMKRDLNGAFPDVPYWERSRTEDLATLSGVYGAYPVPHAFGIPLIYGPDRWPSLNPTKKLSIEEIERLETDRILGGSVVEDLLRQAEIIEREWGGVHGYLNWQGVLNNAFNIRGQEIFLDMVERPELSISFFDLIQAVPQRSEWRPPPCSVLVTSRES